MLMNNKGSGSGNIANSCEVAWYDTNGTQEVRLRSDGGQAWATNSVNSNGSARGVGRSGNDILLLRIVSVNWISLHLVHKLPAIM